MKKTFYIRLLNLAICVMLLLFEGHSMVNAKGGTKSNVIYADEIITVSLIQMAPLADIALNEGFPENGKGWFAKNRNGLIFKVYKLQFTNKTDKRLKLNGEVLDRIMPENAIQEIEQIAEASKSFNRNLGGIYIPGSYDSDSLAVARLKVWRIPKVKQKMIGFIQNNVFELSPIKLTLPPNEVTDFVFLIDRFQDGNKAKIVFEYSVESETVSKTIQINVDEKEASDYLQKTFPRETTPTTN